MPGKEGMAASRGRAASRPLLVALSLAAAVAASPLLGLRAEAATHTILGYGPGAQAQCGVSNSYCWAPAGTTMPAGDTVSWANGTGFHQVAQDGSNWPSGCPNQALGTCVISTPGTYAFHCAIHGTVMSGTVTVTGAAPTPTPPPTPSPSPTRPPTPVPSPVPSPRPTPSTAPPAAPSPTPSPAQQALAASPSPTDPATPGPATPAQPATGRSAAGAGGGSPLPIVLIGLLLAGAGGVAFYWFGIRRPAQ